MRATKREEKKIIGPKCAFSSLTSICMNDRWTGGENDDDD